MSKFRDKPPERRELERLTDRTNEALDQDHRFFGSRVTSKTHVKDFGMHGKVRRQSKRK